MLRRIPTASKENASTKSSDSIYCDTDWDCFIKASQGCNSANFTNIVTIEIFGVKQTTTSYFEIKGLNASKCTFYLRTEKINLTSPPKISQNVVDQEKEAYKKLEGRDGTCKFNTTAVLTAM